MSEIDEELILNGSFLKELIKIADECICTIDTPAGSMQFSYSIK